MKKALLAISLIMCSLTFILAQSDTSIEAVTITGHPANSTSFSGANFLTTIDTTNLQNFPDYSFEQILQDLGGLDIRQRGVDGTQADISIRGSSFDQVLVLVDGINVSDFQTGHHTLNIPIPDFAIRKIQILEGSAARLYGINALAGVINIFTPNLITENQVKGKFFLGQYGYQNFEAYTQFKAKTSFLLDFSKSLSKGYDINTDFDITKAFLAVNHKFKSSQINFKSGFLGKNYGALNFYTPFFPYQYEKILNWLNILSHTYTKHNFTTHTAVYQRLQSEIFELFREGKGWYEPTQDGYFVMGKDTAKYVPNVYEPWNYYHSHNFHLTSLYGLKNSSTILLKNQKLNFGGEIRFEQIRSNVLGSVSDSVRFPFYPNAFLNHYAKRLNINIFSNYALNLGHFRLSTGALALYSSQYGAHVYFGGDFSYNLPKLKIYFSANQAMREPTFTDLYYQGPSNIGNPNLKPEQATTYELGLKKFSRISLEAALFYRQGKNIIDWVRANANEKWHTMNYTKLNTYGLETQLIIRPKTKLFPTFYLTYRHLNQSKVSDSLLSKYALDYMKNFVSGLMIGSYHNFGYRVNLIYEDRNGSFELFNAKTGQFKQQDYTPHFIAYLALSYTYKKIRFYISVDNLLNERYYDLGNVLLPGRWIKVGISFKLASDKPEE